MPLFYGTERRLEEQSIPLADREPRLPGRVLSTVLLAYGVVNIAVGVLSGGFRPVLTGICTLVLGGEIVLRRRRMLATDPPRITSQDPISDD